MAKRKKARVRRASTSRTSRSVIHHSHPAYGYIALAIVFLVLVALLSGMK